MGLSRTGDTRSSTIWWSHISSGSIVGGSILTSWTCMIMQGCIHLPKWMVWDPELNSPIVSDYSQSWVHDTLYLAHCNEGLWSWINYPYFFAHHPQNPQKASAGSSWDGSKWYPKKTWAWPRAGLTSSWIFLYLQMMFTTMSNHWPGFSRCQIR